MWNNIIHIEINRLLEARDEAEKTLIAKSVVRKALLEFYFDWTTRPEFERNIIYTKMFKRYVRTFIEVAVEVHDILPEKVTNNLLSLVKRLKELASEPPHTANLDSYETLSNECMCDVHKMFENFESYFD
jgi:hypothetical protein